VFAILVPFLAVAGGLWFFSVNEFKAPPARVVPVPQGFEVIGGDTDGGSGGTTARWVYLKPPGDDTAVEAVQELMTAMTVEGWEPSDSSAADGSPISGPVGLLRRGDEWAVVSSSDGIDPWMYESLGLSAIEATDGEFVVIELGYSDLGVGRRCLVCN
jgi:hypothetical protein